MDENEIQDTGSTDTGAPAADTPADAGPSLLDTITSAVSEIDSDAPAAGGEQAAAEASAAAQMLRDAQGRFAGKAPADAAAQLGAKPAAAADPNAPKPPPAVDPLREPEGLQPAAKERFQALVGMVKERDTQLAEVRQQAEQATEAINQFGEMLRSSQLSDQEFAQALDYGRAVKTGDWQTVEGILAQQLAHFRMATGRDPAQSDPIAMHQDLAQAVQAGQLSPQNALDIAKARAIQAQAEQMNRAGMQQRQQHEQAQRQEAEFNAAIDQAAASVSTLVKQWAATDLDWPKKQALIQDAAQTIAQTMHPSQWAAAVKQQYDLITRSVQTLAPPMRTPAGPGNQPLRPMGGPAGQKQPASTLEAVTAALQGYHE